MTSYKVTCLVEGDICAKGEESMSALCETANYGMLTYIEFAPDYDEDEFYNNKYITVQGEYTIYVQADSEEEAISLAKDKWAQESQKSGTIGDLEDVRLAIYGDGKSFRCKCLNK